VMTVAGMRDEAIGQTFQARSKKGQSHRTLPL